MINLEKSITKILKKKFIFEDILIIGGGNWARFYLKVLTNSFFKIKKIFIFSKHNKKKIISFLKENSDKNIELVSNIDDIKKCSKNIIIVNKNSEHFRFIKLFSKKKFKVLVEKPVVYSINQYDLILNSIKKKNINFLVGFQRYYAVYFHYFKNRYLKKSPIKIEFLWFDGRRKINDEKKYLENILYHVTSILFIFLKKKEMKMITKEKRFLKFYYGKSEVKISFLRKSGKKLKKIKFYFDKKPTKSIDWTDENKIYYKINKKKQLYKPLFSVHNLQYQLFYFLSASKKNFKKLPNNILNFEYLIKFNKDINKYEVKK